MDVCIEDPWEDVAPARVNDTRPEFGVGIMDDGLDCAVLDA